MVFQDFLSVSVERWRAVFLQPFSSKRTDSVLLLPWARGRTESASASCKNSRRKHRLTDFSISRKGGVDLESKQKLRKAHISFDNFLKIPWSQRHWMWAAVSTGDPGDCAAGITMILPRIHCSCMSQIPEKVGWPSHSGTVRSVTWSWQWRTHRANNLVAWDLTQSPHLQCAWGSRCHRLRRWCTTFTAGPN